MKVTDIYMTEVQKKLKYFDINTQQTLPIENGNIKPSILVKDPNPHMPLIDAICTRRTARAYDRNNPVSFDTFKWIIHHSMHAPSSCNEQKWKVLLIKDKSLITELYERGSASFLKNSNQCFLLCYSNESDNNEWSDSIQSGAAFINTFSLLAHSIGVGTCWIGHLPNKSEVKRMFKKKADFYSTQSCAAGIQNLLLRATSLGIDSAWVRTFNAERIRSLLKIPEDMKIDALITLGYADSREPQPKINELKNIVYFEEWGKSEL